MEGPKAVQRRDAAVGNHGTLARARSATWRGDRGGSTLARRPCTCWSPPPL